MNRLLAGSNFGAGELLAGKIPKRTISAVRDVEEGSKSIEIKIREPTSPNENSAIDTAGEHYSTTYEAEGAVTLAVMSANEFHACTDRAIINKSNTTTGAGPGQTGSSVS